MSNSFYSDISVGRLYQQIINQIEKQILDGDLKPGDRLPSERELGNQFGVSRTSVR
ncbi:MAG: GntR family transcriptional regulator, partial [Anaerolineae bacterium]|nr:GntR family transcriptional regulator [Anaerolineae bacterium]